MTDLVLLVHRADGATPNASTVRELIQQAEATVASLHLPRKLPDGGLEPTQFADCHIQCGVDLALVSDDFRMRDIILIKTARKEADSDFALAHIWNWPSSTYDINAVRIPHEGPTDPRNNPQGKNPGNIWAFGKPLRNRAGVAQLKLFTEQNPAVLDGNVDIGAIERLVKCHTAVGDKVHVWAPQEDVEEIRSAVKHCGRVVLPLPPGSPDPARSIPVIRDELEVRPAQVDLEGRLPPRGGSNRAPPAEYYICDCRYGLRHADFPPISDVVTSPPYNIGYSPFNVPKPDPFSGKLVSPVKEGYNDELPPEKYHDLIGSVFELIDSRSGEESNIFVNIKNNYSGATCNPPFWLIKLLPAGWRLADLLIWRYDISYDPARGKYKPYYEWVFRFTRGRPRFKPGHKYLRDMYIPIVKGNSSEREGLIHPAIYPKELVFQCLEESDGAGVVVDPFLGSGTTLAAACEKGRRSVGFEMDERFVSDIEKRLASVKRYVRPR